MRSWLWVLTLALAVQCFWVAQLRSGSPSGAVDTASPSVMAVNPDLLDEIHIGDDSGREAVLLRRGDRWVLPELGELPVDAEKVALLLNSIGTADKGWPVADTVAARQRFQVASYHYQRRLTLIGAGELLGTLYIGSSPGFRKVHVRNDADDAIYAIAFNSFDAPADDNAWLDRDVLRVRTPVRIDADGYSVQRGGQGWRSGQGKIPEEREIKALLTTLENLQVGGVADPESQRMLSSAEAALVLDIESLAGQVTLSLYQVDNQHFIHSTEFPWFFQFSRYQFELLNGIDVIRISGDS